MPFTALNLCEDAAREIGVVGEGNSLGAADATFLLGVFNRLLDKWNAERAAVYASAFASFTLTPALSPHTIGPTGATFTVTQRPVSLVSASLILSGGSLPIYRSLNVRDADWWAAETVPTLSTSIPTDVYYQPDWPNGKLYFWPVPDTAYQVDLETRVLLAEMTLDDTVSLPPGYRDALTLTVAEQACRAFGRPVAAELARSAAKARARVFANNDVTPALVTQDAGMPSSGGSYFNWRSGLPF
jgi:hypothetical protein